MINASRLLIEAGFAGSKFKKEYPEFNEFSKEKQNEILKKLEDKKTIHEYADHDGAEIVKDQIVLLDYPKPVNRYFATYEAYHQSIEPVYFLCLNLLKDMGFAWIEKILDMHAATEQSSFYGGAAQRLSFAQDKASQFFQLVGQFVRRDLFQLVRDIRWIDERIKFHEDARKGMDSAEITLKGIWTDIVDGVVQGQRVAANIFQLAQQLNFITLPDLFFATHPKTTEDVDKLVDNLNTTRPVASVLKRKLYDYMVWREKNYEELKQRKQFELRYLRQQYNIIRIYMAWLKPYLKHIEYLEADVKRLGTAELISSFEGSMVEIEILGATIPEGNKDVFSCILMTFEYRTRPSLEFQREGFQHRGPIHVGETKITWRSYAWTREQIENYKKMKEKEDLALLSTIDSSINETMKAIGDDLIKYLKQAEESVEEWKQPEEKKPAPERPGMFEPFEGIYGGLKDFISAFVPFKTKSKPKTSKQAKENLEKEKATAEGKARALTWNHYKLFKKSNGMLAW